MKKIFMSVLAISVITFAACNSGDKSSKQDDMSKMKQDSSTQTATKPDADIATVTPTFANLDAKVAGDIKTVVSHYLHVKNALANDNADEAANGAKAMSDALTKVDKSFFTPEQKKIYDENEADLKEHAEHISKSKIDHQREHFSMMSEDMYALVKAFGGGQTLYHDHCPMYNDNKGALWLSEAKEIKNPYMGSSMPKCGKVEEIIN
jgi:hypothetical protein